MALAHLNRIVARAATVGDITLSGLQTIDGVALAADDTILVKNQSATEQNGIYLAKSGAWERSSEGDTPIKLQGIAVVVLEGTINTNSRWFSFPPAPITIDSTPIIFTAVGLLLTDADFNPTYKDGTPSTFSLRTLGTGAQQACAGNDSRLSDARTRDTWRIVLPGKIDPTDSADGVWVAARPGKVRSVKALCRLVSQMPVVDLKKTDAPTTDLPAGGTSMLTSTLTVSSSKAVFSGSLKSDGSESFLANTVLHVDVGVTAGADKPENLTVIVEVQYDP